MNIALLNLSPDLLEGELQTFFLAHALRENAAGSLVLICRAGSPLQALAQENGLTVLPLTAGAGGKILGRLKLRWFFRRNPGRWILHTHDHLAATLGASLARKQHDLLLIHSRHTALKTGDGKLEGIYQAGLVTACETQEIAYAMAAVKVRPQSLKIIHGGIDPRSYPARQARGDKRLIFACPGRLTEDRGHERFIRALPFFQQFVERAGGSLVWEARISGAGPLFTPLLELARGLAVDSHLAFLGGQASKTVLPDCDVLVAPAESGEGCSLPIMEGWAVGLPVLCADSMAHQEMTANRADVLFFRSGSSEDLAEKMWELAQKANLRAQLVSGGKKALQHFTSEAMAKRYLEYYQLLPKLAGTY